MTFKSQPGEWKLLGGRLVEIKLKGKEFKYEFNAMHSEAVLVEPVRKPKSKIVISFDDDDDEQDVARVAEEDEYESELSEEEKVARTRLARHLCNNQFLWLEDGVNSSGEMWFDNEDFGQYMKC